MAELLQVARGFINVVLRTRHSCCFSGRHKQDVGIQASCKNSTLIDLDSFLDVATRIASL
jgi:hypothetical protein